MNEVERLRDALLRDICPAEKPCSDHVEEVDDLIAAVRAEATHE